MWAPRLPSTELHSMFCWRNEKLSNKGFAMAREECIYATQISKLLVFSVCIIMALTLLSYIWRIWQYVNIWSINNASFLHTYLYRVPLNILVVFINLELIHVFQFCDLVVLMYGNNNFLWGAIEFPFR